VTPLVLSIKQPRGTAQRDKDIWEEKEEAEGKRKGGEKYRRNSAPLKATSMRVNKQNTPEKTIPLLFTRCVNHTDTQIAESPL
jgi:hypothetical protein